MLIAGFMYVIDIENRAQYRRDHPSRRRRIKRDIVDIPDRKGVAGIVLRSVERSGGDGDEAQRGGIAAASTTSSVVPPSANSQGSTTRSSSSRGNSVHDLSCYMCWLKFQSFQLCYFILK